MRPRRRPRAPARRAQAAATGPRALGIGRCSLPGAGCGGRALRWLLDVEVEGAWSQSILPGAAAGAPLPPGATRAALRAVSRAGAVGPPAVIPVASSGR